MRIRNLALIAFLALLPLSALADTTYTYKGNDFTYYEPPYTASDSISGYFTVASPLAPYLSFSSISYTSYSFSDGVQTLTNLNTVPYDFVISTDGSGSIVQWDIGVEDTSLRSFIETDYEEDPLHALDYDRFWPSGTSGAVASVEYDQGTWTSPTTSSNPPGTTPEPSSLFLLGTGLLGAVGAARRRITA